MSSPYLWLVVAPVLWSGNLLFGKLLSTTVPPYLLTTIRWSGATLVLALILLIQGQALRLPPRRSWVALAWMAVSGIFGFNVLVYIALHTLGTVEVALIQASTPVYALLLARLALDEPLGWPQAGGALLTVAGVIPIVSHGNLAVLLGLRLGTGDLLMLLAAICWAIYTVAAKHASQQMPSLLATFHAIWLGTLMLIPFAAWEWVDGARMSPTPITWLGLVYVCLFPSVGAYLAWNYGVSQVGAGRGSVFNNLLPLFTAIWAVLLLREPIGWLDLLGGVLIVTGVTLSARRSGRAGPATLLAAKAEGG